MARQFYYDTGTEKVGPVSGTDLVRLRASGEINDETWVRRADNNTWRPLHTVNLSEEEEEERNPGFFTLLGRSGLLGPVLIIVLGLVLFIVLAIGALQLFWPVLLVLFIFWILGKALR
ncbi:MAG: DUF4339 domain-containing protein [Akkermansia sp.]|nr:DUF4339 domain-containing protein [Akkermansia sp.]MBR6577147.1 DUF4339 domain-containing protein [Akkermansia sp.]